MYVFFIAPWMMSTGGFMDSSDLPEIRQVETISTVTAI
jgi:hypothetical protein